MAGRLAGKVAIVTGSGSGIGQAVAERLAQEGADVVIDFRDHVAAAEETKAKIEAAGGKSVMVKADVSKLADSQNLVDQAWAQLGGCDILVNNAGIEKRAVGSGVIDGTASSPGSTSSPRALLLLVELESERACVCEKVDVAPREVSDEGLRVCPALEDTPRQCSVLGDAPCPTLEDAPYRHSTDTAQHSTPAHARHSTPAHTTRRRCHAPPPRGPRCSRAHVVVVVVVRAGLRRRLV